MRSIARFERLTSLSLAGCLQVDDDTLMSLSGLSQLRFLSLLFLDRYRIEYAIHLVSE